MGEIHGVLVHPKTNPKLPNLLEVARVRGEDTVCTSQLSSCKAPLKADFKEKLLTKAGLATCCATWLQIGQQSDFGPRGRDRTQAQ